jgi:hypothetical protein
LLVDRFYYGPDTYYGEEVSVLEMDGSFDKLEVCAAAACSRSHGWEHTHDMQASIKERLQL